MKKWISLLTAAVLLALCSVTGFAKSVNITTATDEEVYVISYPADTQIPWEAAEHTLGAVQAAEMQLAPGSSVTVSVSSQNGFKLVQPKAVENEIPYTLHGAEEIVFYPRDYGKAFPLSVTVEQSAWQKAAAGEHADLLTFTVEYKSV